MFLLIHAKKNLNLNDIYLEIYNLMWFVQIYRIIVVVDGVIKVVTATIETKVRTIETTKKFNPRRLMRKRRKRRNQTSLSTSPPRKMTKRRGIGRKKRIRLMKIRVKIKKWKRNLLRKMILKRIKIRRENILEFHNICSIALFVVKICGMVKASRSMFEVIM